MSILRARAAVFVVAAGAASLAACSDGDEPLGGLRDATEDTDAPALDLPASAMPELDVSEQSSSESVEIRPPEFVLTGALEPPAGTVLDPANCGRPDDSGPPYFDYYVPASWVLRGSGSGGSGGVTGSGDHSYELPDGTVVHVEIATDSYLGDQPVDGSGMPWTTWDYDLTTYDDDGEETNRIVYTSAGQVSIDGVSFDLWFLDQDQSEMVSRIEYKLRIVFADVPTGMPADHARRPESAEVTISWNASDGELGETVVRDLLATFRVAPCAQEGLTELYGMLTGADFSNVPAPTEGD